MKTKCTFLKLFPVLLFTTLSCTLNTDSVHAQQFLNLDFEVVANGKSTCWFFNGTNYVGTADDSVKYSGKYSAKIESQADPKLLDFGTYIQAFPLGQAIGKEVVFTAKVKIETNEGGRAGIWFRVDGEKEVLGFDNTADRMITGNTDWTDFSITLKVDEQAIGIAFGGLLSGKGTAWFDNFEVYIDGEKYVDIPPRTTPLTQEEKAYLKKHIYPLESYEPEHKSWKDLKVLNHLIADAKIVALGEVSHGSREIFKMKHRIVKHLAENEDFDIFSIEASMPEAYKVNDYINGLDDSLSALIKGMHFWTWSTEEVYEMADWMRTFHESGHPISFTGFDMQFFSGPVNELMERFEENEDVYTALDTLYNTLRNITLSRRRAMAMTIPDEQQQQIDSILALTQSAIKSSALSRGEVAWLEQNIRIIRQNLDKNHMSRDRYMADNLLWIRNRNPASKIVAWAHNGHIQKTSSRMGQFVSDSIHNDYVTFGFAFYKGSYTAAGSEGLKEYPAQEAYPGTYEYFLHSMGEPYFILDLKQLKAEKDSRAAWLLGELGFRGVGAVKMEEEFMSTNISEDFDYLIFIDTSTSSVLLD